MKTVILAGRLGTRLSEETDLRPKPMAEIAGALFSCTSWSYTQHKSFRNFYLPWLQGICHILPEFFAASMTIRFSK